MSSIRFIKRHLNDRAVYWADPKNDGYGGLIYNDPVEIPCRWEDYTRVVDANDVHGTKFISNATVYVDRVLDYEGRLFRGTLSQLNDYFESSAASYIDPRDVDKAYLIRRVERIPELGKNRKSLFVVYLTP